MIVDLIWFILLIKSDHLEADVPRLEKIFGRSYGVKRGDQFAQFKVFELGWNCRDLKAAIRDVNLIGEHFPEYMDYWFVDCGCAGNISNMDELIASIEAHA